MECFNVIYAHLSVRIFVYIPETVLYVIYTLAFPFDLRCESVTYIYNTFTPQIKGIHRDT